MYTQSTENKSIFSNLERVADSVVALFGKNCEACIHDLTKLQSSLVYITGDVTGRKPGAPATDLLIRKLKQNSLHPRDIHNYKTITKDGRSLKSSTTFIQDKNGMPIAAFCINFDTTELYNASQALIPLLNLSGNESSDNNETFSHSATETIKEVFSQGVAEVGKHPATMSVDEKTQLITYLEENGVFQLKGSVEEVGQLMGVTKFTVYNYLKRIRNHK